MGEKKEFTEEEMLAEIDKVLSGEPSGRFTPAQAEKIRKRMINLRIDSIIYSAIEKGFE